MAVGPQRRGHADMYCHVSIRPSPLILSCGTVCRTHGRTQNYMCCKWDQICLIFFKMFCDDNIYCSVTCNSVSHWFQQGRTGTIHLWRIGSLFCDDLLSFIIIFSGLAPSLVICDKVTKFVTVETTSMTNKCNVTRKSSWMWTFLLVTRLQRQIPKIIDIDQTRFIKGRLILENFVYAMELVQCCNRRKLPTLVLELDFAKAFDHTIMVTRGFPDQWCRWVARMLSTSKMD
jgi:hypothetical protein